MLDNFEKAEIVRTIIKENNWKIKKKVYASTGSIYYEINRNNEWLIIRIADHKQQYKSFIKTISIDPTPYGYSLDDFEEFLKEENIGDIF